MKQITIKKSFFSLMTIATLIITFAIIVILYFSSVDIIMRITKQEIKENSESIITETINYLSLPAGSIHFLASHIQNNAINIVENKEKVWKLLWDLLEIHSGVMSVYIGDIQGNMLLVKKDSKVYRITTIVDRMNADFYEFYRNQDYEIVKSEKKTTLYDPRTRPWFQNTSTEDKAYYSDIYAFYNTKLLGLTISHPILDENNNISAIVGADILIEDFNFFLQKKNISENSRSFITNIETGLIIAYSNPDSITKFADKAQNAQNTNTRLLYLNNIKKPYIRNLAIDHFNNNAQEPTLFSRLTDKYLFSSMDFPDTFEKPWRLISSVPKKDRTKFLTTPIMTSMVTIVVFITVFIVILNIAINRITKPILNISDQLGDMKNFYLNNVQYISTNYKEIHTINDAMIALKRGLTFFGKYVNVNIVRKLIEEEHAPTPGGIEKNITVMFSDIQGFTGIAEQIPPVYLTQHLSEYFSALSNIIMKSNGTIDKYIGDAIMAFWNAPQEMTDHELIACNAVYQCNKKLTELNNKWEFEQKPLLHTRFGLHTGTAIVGNIGSNDRLNYSALGDTINISSRLESLNKTYMTNIILSEKVYESVKDHFYCRVLDSVVVKGRKNSIKIYEMIGSKTDDDRKNMEALCQAYEKAFALYMKKDFARAYKIYTECFAASENTDKTSAILKNKCAPSRSKRQKKSG